MNPSFSSLLAPFRPPPQMKKKVDEQLANGEEVYQLKVEPRKARRAAQQQAAQQGGGPAAPAAKQRPKNRAQKELEDLRNLD